MLLGLVGRPNTGKSTFFKALTLADVAIAPYPFTTLEKNEGVAFVKTECPEAELKVKCKPNHGFCLNGERFVPVKIIDVAGLVPGAHIGKGRGNQFLNDLREADCLIHIVDASGKTDAEGKFTNGYDPCKDIEFLQDEIDLWFYGIVSDNWKSFARKFMAEQKMSNKTITEEIARKLSGLKINESMVINAIKKLKLDSDISKWIDSQLLSFVRELRKMSKPLIISANKADLPEAEENIKNLQEKFKDTLIVPCSAECELALREASFNKLIEYIPGDSHFKILKEEELTEQKKKALLFIQNYLQKHKNTGIQKCLNTAVYDYLKFITLYPVENENHYSDKNGNTLPDAFLLPSNSTALDLAYAIHTDLGNKFISAIDARTKKRMGKEHILKDKDVIKIISR